MNSGNLFKTQEPKVYFKSSETMEEVLNDSIQLIVTSPPYGKIKDYGNQNQIGFFGTFDDYFKRLKQVWSECYRVLEPQCRMVINIGDQYLRTSEFGRYRVLSIASRIITDCLDLGFDFLGDIIWQKISTTNTTGGCSLMGSIYYPRNGLLTYDYEHILIFKKYQGKNKRKVDPIIKEMSKIPLSEWKKWYTGHWKFPGVVQKEHIAMFPEELPYRIIRMFSYIGDTVLDPFLGSGTTLKVAKSLFRNGIGYELNKDYKKTVDNKVENSKPGLFRDYQFMLYKLSEKARSEKIEIQIEKQKQKGVVFLKNAKEIEVILDYLLIEEEIFNQIKIKTELDAKLKENTVLRYLEGILIDKKINCYVILINSKFDKDINLKPFLKAYLSNANLIDKIKIITMSDFLSDDFNTSSFFL
ncbi:MAG: site-specific DNA-methyltransferase [Candidatus Lokiarchaeota archaeon]|nr:site-specific DNA-methyltransferase [Candidatus Lokiarchaeota archaeon]